MVVLLLPWTGSRGARGVGRGAPHDTPQAWQEAPGHRPTDVNGGSSRSHAVCQIVVAGGGEEGLLTLVDCAGSERKEDSMYHDKERQRESTEINASLYALKVGITRRVFFGVLPRRRQAILRSLTARQHVALLQECVRARALCARGRAVQIPFRSSSLTKVLMESFVRPDARLAVIATVSPIPTDTEHSISTLRTVCAIAGFEERDLVEEKVRLRRLFRLPAAF